MQKGCCLVICLTFLLQLDLKDKLVLAPLTTIGNLPFRRICKGLGADITCGEMARIFICRVDDWLGDVRQFVARPSVRVVVVEKAPVWRRVWSADMRVAHGSVSQMQCWRSTTSSVTRCAELLDQTIKVDYLDINFGCPIDIGAFTSLLNRHLLVVNKGAGSALLEMKQRMRDIVTNVAKG
jgi:tRNA-dihydrouridine synthase 3